MPITHSGQVVWLRMDEKQREPTTRMGANSKSLYRATPRREVRVLHLNHHDTIAAMCGPSSGSRQGAAAPSKAQWLAIANQQCSTTPAG